jgi:aldehyde dehydrogenase (NAD+)
MTPITPFELKKLGDSIHKNRDEFLEILTRIATWKSAQDEIDHAIETLHGAPEELSEMREKTVNLLSVYLPPNVILFSYVLYIAMPSPYVRKIFFRPSVRCREEAYAIHQNILRLINLPAAMSYSSRSIFWKDYTARSNIVIFTGKCQNAFEVRDAILPNQMFIYFGAGINPLIVGQNANINMAARDTVLIRLNNSGQDCLCPDLILVHESVSEKFVNELKSLLDTVVFGEKPDPKTDYSNLSYPDVAEFCNEYLTRNTKYIVYGGNINVLERYVQPTILKRDISELDSLPEFFAPIFNIAIYKNDEQVKSLLDSEIYKNKSMGAMLYGAKDMIPLFDKKHVVTIDQTLLEINHGNLPFGGFDQCASHIRYNNEIISQPLLISDIVRKYFITAKGS